MTDGRDDHDVDPLSRRPVESSFVFDRYGVVGGGDAPRSAVVISVPHAGRNYPSTLLAQSRVPAAILRRLEDRHADVLAHMLIEQGHEVLVARAPRALIDLNRNEREIDPALVHDLPFGVALLPTAKMRGGLGLFPRRLHGAGELWQRPFNWAELQDRIRQVHQPYHSALAAMMARARDAHGYAILIDLHSMPPLAPTLSATPQIVLGDRFGRSASSRLLACAADLIQGQGIMTAQNHPYPGNYLIDRHGKPERDLHALQIEIDRTLYLDGALERVGPEATSIQMLLVKLADALADEWPVSTFMQAAE